MKPKLTVGQTLYSLNVGNAARNREQKLTPVKVESIGKKYFTAGGTKFHLSTWREKTEYCADERLYATEKEYEDKKESEEIARMVSEKFKWGRPPQDVSIEGLREIRKILSANNVDRRCEPDANE